MADPGFPPIESADRPYPAVRLLRRYGNWFVLGLGVVFLAAGAWASVAGHGAIWLFAGLAAGAFAAFLMKSYVELIRIIADMLLPR
jgi:hypothetical protein